MCYCPSVAYLPWTSRSSAWTTHISIIFCSTQFIVVKHLNKSFCWSQNSIKAEQQNPYSVSISFVVIFRYSPSLTVTPSFPWLICHSPSICRHIVPSMLPIYQLVVELLAGCFCPDVHLSNNVTILLKRLPSIVPSKMTRELQILRVSQCVFFNKWV